MQRYTYIMRISLVIITCLTIFSFLFSFSNDNIVLDECLLLVQKLNERIQFFAKKCKKNAPARCLTLQELTKDSHALEMFVNSIRSTKICKWLMLEGSFEFQTRKAKKVGVLISHVSHVPQRFMERCNLSTYYTM